MKKIILNIIFALFVLVFWYLCTAFVLLDLDFRNWIIEIRVLVMVEWILSTTLILAFWQLKIND